MIGYSALFGLSTIPLSPIICYNYAVVSKIMNFIWSPWRMEYIQPNIQHENCILCELTQQPDNAENLIMYRGQRVFIMLNRYTYTSGHLMVVPFEHKPSLDDLDRETSIEIMELTQKSIRLLRSVYQPQGFNVGVNIGEAAGAGIVGHIHLHVVPRWLGDTNFMSTLATTRVLPESLVETYRRLKEAWQRDIGAE